MKTLFCNTEYEERVKETYEKGWSNARVLILKRENEREERKRGHIITSLCPVKSCFLSLLQWSTPLSNFAKGGRNFKVLANLAK